MTKPTLTKIGRSKYDVHDGERYLGFIERLHGDDGIPPEWHVTTAAECHSSVSQLMARFNKDKYVHKQDAVAAIISHPWCHINGDLFPAATILHISTISLNINPNPSVGLDIIAKITYNTGPDTQFSMMIIDLEKGEIRKYGTKKIMRFTNQDEMFKKVGLAIRNHLTEE